MSKYTRVISILLLTCVLAGCGLLTPVEPQDMPTPRPAETPVPTATPVPTGTPAADPDAEEYKVYSDLIRAEYGARGMVVIHDTTGPGLGGPITDTLENAGRELKGLQAATRQSFVARNDREYPLIPGSFSLDMPVVLISQAETAEFFGDKGAGWDGFYEKYPDAQGMLELSRVGFNATMDQALVYAGNQAHWLAGVGWLILLEKHGEQWEIVNRIVLWIS